MAWMKIWNHVGKPNKKLHPMQTAMLNDNSLLASIGKFFQSMDK